MPTPSTTVHTHAESPGILGGTAFTDTLGRRWSATITIATIRGIKETLGVDLLDMASLETFGKLMDPMTFADMLWLIVEPQAQPQNVTEADFGGALGGDTIEQATTAVLESITSFFRPAQRDALRAGLKKFQTLETQNCQKAIRDINSVELPDATPMPSISGD